MSDDIIDRIRAHVSQVVRELGMVVHHVDEANSNTADDAEQQMIEDLSAACDAAMMATEHACRLEHTIKDFLSLFEKKRTSRRKKKRGKNGSYAGDGRCVKCGCTHSDPCVNQFSGETCHWVKPGLCSACASEPSRPRRQRGKKGGAR